MVIFEIDIHCHVWYHTPANMKCYNSWNPITNWARFVGVKWFERVCSKIGLLDKHGHMAEHHCERANTMQLIGNWTDWFAPTYVFSNPLMDWMYAELYQNRVLIPDRGTHLPVGLNDLFHIHDCPPLAGALGMKAPDVKASFYQSADECFKKVCLTDGTLRPREEALKANLYDMKDFEKFEKAISCQKTMRKAMLEKLSNEENYKTRIAPLLKLVDRKDQLVLKEGRV